MTWILASFLVTPCALTSCYVLISKQGMEECQGSPVQLVCNRKVTTWYENHAVRFKQSRVRDTQPIRGVRSSLTIQFARWCKRWSLLAPWRRFETRRSPLSEYMSLYLSLKLTTNCGPLARIKWDVFYIYVFRSFIAYNTTQSVTAKKAIR